MTPIQLTACSNQGFSHYAHWEDDDSRYHVWMWADGTRDSVVHINAKDPNGRDHHTRQLSAKAQAWILPMLASLTPADFEAATYAASVEGKAKAEALRVENLSLAAHNLNTALGQGDVSTARDDCAILLHRLAAKLGYQVTALPPPPPVYQDDDLILEAMERAEGPLQRFDVIVTRDVTESQVVTLWEADADTARAEAVHLAENHPDAWAVDNGNAWDSGYVTGCDPNPVFVPDFDPLAKGAALTLFREELDPGDPWGSAMSFAFDLAGALGLRGADVPSELGYCEGAGGHHVESDRVTTMASLGTEALTHAGRVLGRYIDRCRAAGLDY